MPSDEGSEDTEHGRRLRSWPALLVGRQRSAPTQAIAPSESSNSDADIGRPGLDERVQAALVDCDVSALEEISTDSLRAFFPTPAARDLAAAALSHEVPDLTIEAIDVPDDDWAARSQASLTHVQVGRIIVAPPWDLPGTAQDSTHKAQGSSDALTVVIQPSMGFGTGHHATTRLCLAALQQLDLQGRAVIDVGTGSGVLAIASSLLGANPVIGLDDDADAIQAARDNLTLNPTAQVTLETTDVRASHDHVADVVIANLTGGLLVSAAGHLQTLVAPGGRLVLSGLMEHEEHDVLAAFDGYDVTRRDREDEWLCVTLQRSSNP